MKSPFVKSTLSFSSFPNLISFLPLQHLAWLMLVCHLEHSVKLLQSQVLLAWRFLWQVPPYLHRQITSLICKRRMSYQSLLIVIKPGGGEPVLFQAEFPGCNLWPITALQSWNRFLPPCSFYSPICHPSISPAEVSKVLPHIGRIAGWGTGRRHISMRLLWKKTK